ncbi:MAG: hypothetical protein ABIK09_16095 [Pseudomonadota bacterium]
MGERDQKSPYKRRRTGEMRLPAHEKRCHDRYALRDMFHCFVGGQKILSLALDQGGGGAFLTMSVLPGIGSVMVVEVESDLQQRQVFLVAEVARRQVTPVKGVGIRWLRAIGLGSPDSLLAFVEHHLRIPIADLRNEAVRPLGSTQRPVIDFEARVLRVMTRAAQEGELAGLMRRGVARPFMSSPPPGSPPPVPEDTVDELPEEVREATDALGMKRVDEAVSYRFGGQAHRGVLRFASPRAFVIESASPLPGRNGRLYVEWSDEHRDGVGEVVLRGEVDRETISPSGTWRVEARITALSEGGRPGLYKEFLLRYGA